MRLVLCKYSLAGRIELLLLQGTKRMGRPIRLRKKSEAYLIVEWQKIALKRMSSNM